MAPPEGAPPSFDRYELLGEIARGGMGVVYRAKDRTTGEVVALKYRSVGHGRHAQLLIERFEREYQILKGLKHPRIIQVFDYGVIPQGAYYTMELIEGRDLGQCGCVPWRQACQYLRDVATSLSLLHARRLVHNDLSAGNVKLTRDGHCKLIDFGALTEFGTTDVIIGTPPFIAPEVLEVGRLDQRADLYALGALGYYCLTGQHAYPAGRIEDLPEVWMRTPPRPSSLCPEVPEELDELVMSLLRRDFLARPASASEIIMRLDVIGKLPPEDEAAQRILAQSFLAAPRYVGRKRELERLSTAIQAAIKGSGQALRVVAPPGAGRTRLLEEVAIRAQLAGAAVVRADVSAQRGRYGALRALSLSLLHTLPDAAHRRAQEYEAALATLGDDIVARLRDEAEAAAEGASVRWPSLAPPPSSKPPPPRMPPSSIPPPRGESPPEPQVNTAGVEDWFVRVSHEQPLAVLVDNVECCDDASLATLIALARTAAHERLLVVVAEQADSPEAVGLGFGTLRAACETVLLEDMTLAETTELMRSLFGDAPRVERLAEWVHAQSAGRPLHSLGIVRQYVAQGIIRNERGAWTLPSSRPDTQVLEELEDALSRRLETLSPEALALAQCLSLHRDESTLELCRLLVPPESPRSAMAFLEELSAADILHIDHERCFFTSAALRQTILRRMGAPGRKLSHKRIGDALATLAGPQDLTLILDAGWHLIRGGDELRGADMIARITQDPIACNLLVANLYRMGEPVEAALKVYREARKSKRERLPLLTALAQSAYYEHYSWGDKYGDEALDVVEELSGLGLARRLTPFLGRYLAFGIAFAQAAIRHYLTPKKVRGGSFINLLIHVCSAVTALCGVAALSLNAQRCERIAQILAPVAVLPKRIALVGIYRFCEGLQHIAREHQIEAYERFEELAAQFRDPKYFLLLPPETHLVYATACHFARGAFAMMRADGSAALESAELLERSGLPLYAMIASQLRYLYHFNRGELALAQPHRERVEVYAARVGYAWQVELWEPASLIPFYIATDDLVELARIAHRLGELSEQVPSMWRYRELATLALSVHTRAPELYERALALVDGEPRRFIGWSTTLAAMAWYQSQFGEHASARELCERALATMTDEDRVCVMIFLIVDIQAAMADAGLGRTEEALARLDHLLALHGPSQHPLTLGLVHEARARIAFAAGRLDIYRESLAETQRWLRPTGTPSLVAICDRLVRLGAAIAPGEAQGPGLVLTDLQTNATDDEVTRILGPTSRSDVG